MMEGAVGLVRHAREIRRRNRAADEGARHLAGDLGIGASGQGADLLIGKNRPDIRHVETAVAGKPGERHVDEAERGGFASGGDVAHRTSWVAARDSSRAPGVSQGCRFGGDTIFISIGYHDTPRRRARQKKSAEMTITAARPYHVTAYCK